MLLGCSHLVTDSSFEKAVRYFLLEVACKDLIEMAQSVLKNNYLSLIRLRNIKC